MCRKKLQLLATIILLQTGLYLKSNAQKITDPVLKNLVKAIVNANAMKPVEKLYVQTDKPYYTVGDTIRLKAYLLNADYFTGSARSGLLYVELDDQNGKMAKRVLFPVVEGLSWGDIALDSTEIPKGNYTLHAYTNWMRNFGEDYIFKKSISISQYENNPLLVNTAFKQADDKVEGEIKLSLLDGRIQAFKDVDMRILNGKRSLARNSLTTGIDGTARFSFALPYDDEKAALTIKAKVKDNPEFTIPIALNRPEETDVQFMPEGGTLVTGLTTVVGVKAISEDGKGINVNGKLLNSKGQEIASISTLRKGMGRFVFTPKIGETYTVKIDGISKTYSLPAVVAAGTGLSVSSNKDSLIVSVNGTDITGTYYLMGQARNVVCYVETINFANLGLISKSVAKSLFPTGIVHFTLLNSNYISLNERITFVNHHDELSIKVDTEKPIYGLRDSIAISLKVTNKTGEPVSGSFSIAVTDDNQIKTNSLGSNIRNNMLLTSDLKGEVEEPEYYFSGSKDLELDNLLLTQGWVGYDWKDVLYPKYPLGYKPEPEFTIRGKVINAFGKPVEKSPVVLFASRPLLIVRDTLTDNAGKFSFSDIFPVDTAIFKIQARNKRNKEFNVGIEMDVVKPPGFKSAMQLQPWYVNADTTLLGSLKIKTQENVAQSLYRGEGTQLKEVKIKAKKVVPGSKNLNGPGEADLILDEEEMKKADKKTLTDLLREKIPAIMEHGLWTPCLASCGAIRYDYTLNFKRLHFVFDGMNLNLFGGMGMSRYTFIKSYLDYYTAEDVTGIELMFNSKYAGAYVPIGGEYGVDAYIEITTRSKQGPFMKVTPGTYLYKTLAFTLPKQFYRPKYTIVNRDKAIGTDMRSTIHWEPNLTTDVLGNANFSFYSADKPGGYTIIIEGGDLNGQIGYGIRKIKIK
nr:hypothetical protein [uncultured Mucilaginibacter sp.]